MTKVILCLIGAWGSTWAEDSSQTEFASKEEFVVVDSVSAETASAEAEDQEELEAPEDGFPVKEAAAEPEDSYLDFSQWANPTMKKVITTSAYKIRGGRLHRGVDVKMDIGDPVVAAEAGKVIISKYNKGGYGNYIIIKHDNGTQTVYGHLSSRLKDVGAVVQRGELIALSGNTGRSTGPHLHFEIRFGDVNIDPATVYNFGEGELQQGVDKYSINAATKSHEEIQAELSKHKYHKIKSGDSLGKIALKYGTTVDKLCKLNNITRETVIKIGKQIQVF